MNKCNCKATKMPHDMSCDIYKTIPINRQPKIGDKVIVRDNQDEPYKIGVLKTFDKMYGSKIPVVTVEQDYWCMGVVVEWNEELAAHLDTLSPKDQWNWLVIWAKRK